MHTVHEMVEEAKLLPVAERRRLLHAIEDSLAKDEEQEAVSVLPGGRCARLLALAGTMHSDHADVSGDKYKHLAEIYADNTEAGLWHPHGAHLSSGIRLYVATGLSGSLFQRDHRDPGTTLA